MTKKQALTHNPFGLAVGTFGKNFIKARGCA